MDWIKAKGKLVYDPIRQDFKKTHKQRTLIVQLPRDQIDLYYQWFLKKHFGQWIEMQRPMFGTHITVVKGDEFIKPELLHLWKQYDGREIEFEYSPTLIERHWQFWSLTVRSARLEAIRDELGLRQNFRLHITFGRQYDWQPKANLKEQKIRDVEFTDKITVTKPRHAPPMIISDRSSGLEPVFMKEYARNFYHATRNVCHDASGSSCYKCTFDQCALPNQGDRK